MQVDIYDFDKTVVPFDSALKYWGFVGIFQFDLVAAIFGGMSGVVSRIIYTLVGLAGIWGITMLFRKRSRPAFMQDDGDA